MDFRDPPPRKLQENLLPMINVIFLLLIFFLLAAQLTPPEPFPVTPPEAQAKAESDGEFTLHLAADGRIAFRDAQGDAALTTLSLTRADHCRSTDCTTAPPRLVLRADAALPADRLAALMPRLADLGFAQIDLVVVTGPAR